ncbi:MAG: PaaI family thioesterase [Hyphomicrobiaceae bacterium]
MTNGPFGDEASAIAEITRWIDEHFPNVHDGGRITFETLKPDVAVLRLASDPSQIRPGGTISGPTMFKIADLAVYVLILTAKGLAAREAVTSNLSINFLRRPKPVDVIARAELLKLGRRLANAQVTIYSAGDSRAVAHATATYAIPDPDDARTT